MLDFMRRHAEGWGVKLLLGFISVSFALFFGYSAYRGRPLGGQSAAEVGDRAIPMAHFRESYDSAVQRLQGEFPDGIPDDFLKYLRTNILSQLIQRSVFLGFANHLGFRISDFEVARTIRGQEQFIHDGIFDMKYYRDRFRPFYHERFGIDYEKALREDLLLDQVQAFESQSMILPSEWNNWYEQRLHDVWDFEVIRVSEAKLKEIFKDAETAPGKIQDLLQSWLEEWKTQDIPTSTLEKYQAVHEKKSLNFIERNKLLGQRIPEEHEQELFSLKNFPALYPKPIRVGADWFLVKIAGQEKVKDMTNENPPEAWAQIQMEFFNLWRDDYRKDLRIRTNVDL